MKGRFEGKTALITGGAKGIGRATVIRFIREGGQATVIDLEPPDSEWVLSLRAELEGRQDALFYVSADGTDEAAVKAAMSAVHTQVGALDILVNNMGFGSGVVPLEDITLETWNRFMNNNMTSAFLVTREVLPRMRQRQSGCIVNVSSIVGRSISEVANIPYHASKAAMLGFTRSLASEEGPHGIRVNAVAPGTTFSERTAKRWELIAAERSQQLISSWPLRRVAKPQEIAGPILFLASEDATYITGASLDVNGGRFMG